MEKNLEFENSVLSVFSDVISQFNLNIEKKYKNNYEIKLHNDKCIIRFIYDMGIIECDFIDPIEKKEKESNKRLDGFPIGVPVYEIYSVWEFLFPNDKTSYRYSGWDIEEQLKAKKNLLLKKLINVLNGDFSWAKAYKENDNRISRKIEYMESYWAMDNPVRIKFNNGDPDWEEAFDEYKDYLDKLQH